MPKTTAVCYQLLTENHVCVSPSGGVLQSADMPSTDHGLILVLVI